MAEEQKPPQSEKPKTQPMGFWIAIGAAIGAGIAWQWTTSPSALRLG